MDYRIVWSEPALEDVEDIAGFIHQDSPYYASVVVDKITKMTREIAVHPLAGRVVPELENNDFRERFVYSYRILYLLKDDVVFIVGVIHGKRLLTSILEEEPPRLQGD